MSAEDKPIEASFQPLPSDQNPTNLILRPMYVFTLVPDAEGQPPEFVKCTSLENMISEIYARMIKHGSGWVYPVVNGEVATISMPRQVFQLKIGDSKLIDIADPAAPAFDAAGRFSTLRERV